MLEGRRDGELLINEYKVSVRDEEKFLEIDRGDAGITLQMYLSPLNCTFKNVLNDKFHVMCILPQ